MQHSLIEIQYIFQELLKGEGVQSKDIKSLKTHAFEMKKINKDSNTKIYENNFMP